MRRAVLRSFLAFALSLPCLPAPARALVPVGAVPKILGASAVAVSPDGANVYAAASDVDTVFVFARDASTGQLTKVQTLSAAAGAIGIFDVGSIALSPDGKYAYVAYRLSISPFAEGISVWARDLGTGTLAFVEVQKNGVGGVTGLRRISSVAVSADGQHVYGRGRSDDDAAIAAFARNATTGALTFLGATTFVSANYGRGQGIALAPDGGHLYAVGDDAVLAFARDGGTGALTYVSTVENGANGVSGLVDPDNLALSPEGSSLYVAAPGSFGIPTSALVVFARDAGTGTLTYVEKHRESQPLQDPSNVIVDPVGARVFVAGRRLHAGVGGYDRDPSTGGLTLVASSTGAAPTTLESPQSLAVSPDNAYLYVADGNADAVLVFDVRCGTGTVESGEGCDDGNLANGDGCNAACNVESCWACSGAPSVCGHDDGASCDDGTVCTTADTCAGGYCIGASNDGVPCDDGQPCTIDDTCFGGGCGGVVEPDPTCRQPTEPSGSDLKIVHNPDDAEDSALQWRLKRGQATTVADFGDPVGGDTRYTTCLYEQVVPPDYALLVQRTAPSGCSSGDCWKARSRGFRLTSSDSKIVLKAGPDGKASVAVTTKQLPWSLGTLPLAPPVTVQLKAWHWSPSGSQTTDACWSATFSAPARNGDSKFKAKSD